MSMSLDIDPLDLVDPERFARHGYPHDVWTRLRAEAPVAYIEPPGHPPFWAVTKHADIVQVATQPQLFSSAQGITLDMDLSGLDVTPEMIVYLDPPQHGPMRQVANKKFLRSAVRARSEEIERIAADLVDQASTGRRDRRVRLRRHLRGTVSGRGHLLGPRRAPRRLGAPLPLDQRDHRQGRSRVPACRGESRADLHAGPRRAAPLLQGDGGGPSRASAGRPGHPAGAERGRRRSP